MNKKITMIIVGIICCLLMFGCNKKNPQDAEISPMSGSYVFDIDSVAEWASNADYIIVGKVLKELKTSYEGFDGTNIYSNYSVEVVENLKGELRQDKPIKITKSGGVTKDGSECILYSSDILPVVDGTYLFFIFVQPDGSNMVGCPNSTIPMDDNALKTNLTTRKSNNTPNSDEVTDFRFAGFDNLSYEEKIQNVLDAIDLNLPSQFEPLISNDDVSKQ